MNLIHLHLVINHAPLFGLVFGFCLLMYSLRKKNDDVHRLALYTFIITTVLSALTFITGEQAEPLVEHINGINMQAVGAHEQTAKIANIFTIITGLTALAWFFIKKYTIRRNISLALLGLSLIGIAYMSRTANLGGLIRHSEIGTSLLEMQK